MNVKLERVLIPAFLVMGFAVSALAAEVRAERVATGLENPWAVAFLPAHRYSVSYTHLTLPTKRIV